MMRDEFQRFLLEYQFGLREVETKLGILRDEFLLMHDYNPIEHVSSRVKSADSLVDKITRKGVDPSFDAIRAAITDIAGIRVTTSFTKDAYRLFDLLTQQDDITVREVKDYIAHPKTNGYKSLHVIVEVPVFLVGARRRRRRGAVPHDRDGFLGEPGAQDLLQVRRRGSRRTARRTQRGGRLGIPAGCPHGTPARTAARSGVCDDPGRLSSLPHSLDA
jgi:hypothetical protein